MDLALQMQSSLLQGLDVREGRRLELCFDAMQLHRDVPVFAEDARKLAIGRLQVRDAIAVLREVERDIMMDSSHAARRSTRRAAGTTPPAWLGVCTVGDPRSAAMMKRRERRGAVSSNRTSNITRAEPVVTPSEGARPTPPHVSFLGNDAADASEHGERSPTPPRADDGTLGTSASHAAAPDARAEEPCGELVAASDP